MDYIRSLPEFSNLISDSDYADSYCVECDKSMRQFLASSLSYMPRWMRFLYTVRAGLVRLLGMRQDIIPSDISIKAEDIPLEAGNKAAFLTVHSAEDERYWIGEVTDRHLKAFLAVVVQPLAGADGIPEKHDVLPSPALRRMHMVTVVKYRHWTGPVYFNIIRPFHHLVVRAMAHHAAR